MEQKTLGRMIIDEVTVVVVGQGRSLDTWSALRLAVDQR